MYCFKIKLMYCCSLCLLFSSAAQKMFVSSIVECNHVLFHQRVVCFEEHLSISVLDESVRSLILFLTQHFYEGPKLSVFFLILVYITK